LVVNLPVEHPADGSLCSDSTPISMSGQGLLIGAEGRFQTSHRMAELRKPSSAPWASSRLHTRTTARKIGSYDFVIDRTEDGRRLKMMPIVDEFSRECLTIEVERSITAEDVVRTLAALFERRGEPSFIRSDNGPEFIAQAVKRWLEVWGVKTLYIEPGSPWENPYSETFISRLGDELLKREVFTSLLEAKVLVEGYRNHYNRERPHSALGYRTPAEFAALCDVDDVEMNFTKEIESATALS
jgi:transposase InsO family protein